MAVLIGYDIGIPVESAAVIHITHNGAVGICRSIELMATAETLHRCHSLAQVETVRVIGHTVIILKLYIQQNHAVTEFACPV